MVVFDTDILSIIQQRSGDGFRAIDTRMRAAKGEAFYTSIVTFEEQMRGWLAMIARARTVEAEMSAYSRLFRLLEYFRERPLLPLDLNSSLRLQELKALRLRIGTMDLKIAAIAPANDALLVSRNLAGFARIPGLRVEDWTRRP